MRPFQPPGAGDLKTVWASRRVRRQPRIRIGCQFDAYRSRCGLLFDRFSESLEESLSQDPELQTVEDLMDLLPRDRDSFQVPTATSSGTSPTNCVSCRLVITWPRWSRSAVPTLPGTSSTWATSSSSEPNCRIHFAAVFSPTPGIPGRLSDGSPRRAA